MPVKIRPNHEKLRELVLIVAKLCRNDPRFGATKLNKLLFFADFLAYLRLGQAITGVEYQKLPGGPAPRAMVPLLNEMKRDGAIDIEIVDFHGKEQFRTVPLREPILGQFTEAEQALVSDVVLRFWEYTGSRISVFSHLLTAYRLANMRETIPYETALVSTMEPTEEIVRIARKLDARAKRFLARARP
jgi:hypothetical protein